MEAWKRLVSDLASYETALRMEMNDEYPDTQVVSSNLTVWRI